MARNTLYFKNAPDLKVQTNPSIHATSDKLPFITPGEVLRTEFLEPAALSTRALARHLGIPASCVTGILNGNRAITAKTALLLSAYFGTTAEFWMNLQATHDLETARARQNLCDNILPE